MSEQREYALAYPEMRLLPGVVAQYPLVKLHWKDGDPVSVLEYHIGRVLGVDGATITVMTYQGPRAFPVSEVRL